MATCMCGDFESEHDPPIFGLPRKCRVRVLLTPPTALLPEGHYERCDCPGYEPDEQDDD